MEDLRTNRNGSQSLPYFLVGLGTGIAITALLIPCSGAETRRHIDAKVDECEDWVKAKATAAKDYVSSQGVELGDRVKEAAKGFAGANRVRPGGDPGQQESKR
jgi:gas vesicle protein